MPAAISAAPMEDPFASENDSGDSGEMGAMGSQKTTSPFP